MLKNYLYIALRNLTKNHIYSIINIGGLAVGIACTLLILLWASDELSFDTFLPKSKQLYLVKINKHLNGKIETWNGVPLPAKEAIKSESVLVANATSSDWGGLHLLAANGKHISKQGFYVGEEFLTMFEFPLLKGDPKQVLMDMHSIVITESTAKAIFGNTDPINQTIKIDNEHECKVTGILKDLPANSTFQFDCLLPWSFYTSKDWVKKHMDNWGNYSFRAYVELKEPNDVNEVESKIKDLLAKHGETDVRQEMILQPYENWRLYSEYKDGKVSGGMIDYVNMFVVIAAFILLIACVNFINLSTARSERRAREVGIRKSVGSQRWEIMLQFMGESFFTVILAFGFALAITYLVLPFYNLLVGKQLAIDYSTPEFWLFSVTVILFTGLVAGSYPAIYLSSFQPVKVLKGKPISARHSSLPRKVLVTTQFGFSILLIIGTLVIFQQIQLVKNRDLGYKQEGLISVNHNPGFGKTFDAFKGELLQSGVASSITRSNSKITQITANNFLGWPGKPENLEVTFATVGADYDYAKTMGIKLLEGRDFSREFKSDTAAVLINKAALDIMGLKNPIGTQLDLSGDKMTLVGVLDNALMGAPDQQVSPTFVVLNQNWLNAVTIRLNSTEDIPGSIQQIERTFKKYNPDYPFEYSFVDVDFAKKFVTIELTSSLATLFTTLALLITGLGLFGLAAFTAEQRTKEIGIRKVMGASVIELVSLISTDFSKLVILAFAVCGPFAWWLLDSYLSRYTYRIEIPLWIFPATGGIALLFAIAIVSTQAFKAANANPGSSLRSE